jgi:hypothetical protein
MELRDSQCGHAVHGALRRREKQGWIDVDATIREAREDEVQSLLEQGSWPLTED